MRSMQAGCAIEDDDDVLTGVGFTEGHMLTVKHDERDDFSIELDDASDVFRLLAEQDLTAVLLRLEQLRLELELEGV